MPKPRHFVLHSRVVPPLAAGDYVLRGDQTVAGGSFDPYEGHFRISPPRFTMPPDLIASTWPPANAEGAFDARLPQIVLRRRTLPWERTVDASDQSIPWLAVVVIAGGEGQLSGVTPVAECVTPGVTLSGPNDVDTGVHLAVPRTVVRQIFPTKEDLPLLAHVREVDIDDTELAMGDDDGFLAVVLANRLPQYDRANCRPVRYLACLVSLDGQLDKLPATADVSDDFRFGFAFDLGAQAAKLRLHTDHLAMGTGVLAPRRTKARDDEGALASPVLSTFAAARNARAAADWNVRPTQIEELAISTGRENAGRLVRDAMGAGFRLPVHLLVREPVYRFPVLAHWSFTSTGVGSFETRMKDLDVGLLGTRAVDRPDPRRADCAEPPAGDAPPGATPPRPDPEVAETGHVGLPHLTRRGESVRAWYRSPLSPHLTERTKSDDAGALPLAHTTDQLRRVVPDGREDLTLAIAFEVGRLLALSQPAVVAALQRWRREQFGAERARRLVAEAARDVGALSGALGAPANELGRLLARTVVLAAADAPEKVLAPDRPLADPGRPVRAVDGDLDQVVAEGFGIPLEQVREALRAGDPVDAVSSIDVPTAGTVESTASLNEAAAVNLHERLTGLLEGLAADVVRPETKAEPRRRRRRDPLDDLLREAADRREKETRE